MALSEEDKKKLWRKEYYQRPEVKAHRKAQRKAQRQIPEVKAQQKTYYQKNKDWMNVRRRKYHQRNKDKINAKKRDWNAIPEVKEKRKVADAEYRRSPSAKAKKKLYHKKYYSIPKNLEKRNESKRIYRRTYKHKPGAKIRNRLRSRLKLALNYYMKSGKIRSSIIYGVDYKAIIQYLKPFPRDMHLYHIDHIKPLCSFNLEDPEEIKKAFAPENHQWLLASDNMSKGAKIEVQSTLF